MNVHQALAVALLSMLGAGVVADEYQISIEDAGDLAILDDEFNSVKHGGHWARCRQGYCYLLETGEMVTNDPLAQDGIYLVFPEDARKFQSE